MGLSFFIATSGGKLNGAGMIVSLNAIVLCVAAVVNVQWFDTVQETRGCLQS